MKTGDKVVLLSVDEVDELSGLRVGQIYYFEKIRHGYAIICSTPDFNKENLEGWGPVRKDQIRPVDSLAAIVHDHLIRDSQEHYWSLSDGGQLMEVGSELEVEEDQNGYFDIPNIQAAWNLLIEEGYVDESN